MRIHKNVKRLKACILPVIIGLVFVTGLKAQTTESTGADHVILISVDGFRPDFYQQENRPTPMLQQMAREGVQVDGVRGIFPSVTYPSHTTIITGAFPVAHSIFFNTPFEVEGQTGKWYWNYNSITTETLWGAASQNDMITASIGWPVTVDAPIDYNIPEIWDPEDEWIAAIRRHTKPEGFLEEIEERATGKLSGDMFSGKYIMREDRVGAMASYILQEYKPNLLTVHLVATDHFQHSYGREHTKVDRALASVDRAISRMVEAVEQAGIVDRTAFVVTGDHGMTNISVRVSPNVWLVEAGLMEASDERGDWRATFHTSGGAAFLYLRDPNDTEAINTIRTILDEQPDAIKNLYRIVERDELDSIGAMTEAPFALTANPIVGFSGAYLGDAISSATGSTHGHFPNFKHMETGFIAWGSGVKKSVRVSQIGMEDIAPLVANLLGIPFDAPNGLVIPGFLEE